MSWEVTEDWKTFMAAIVTQCYYCQKRKRKKEGEREREKRRKKSALDKINISCFTDNCA